MFCHFKIPKGESSCSRKYERIIRRHFIEPKSKGCKHCHLTCKMHNAGLLRCFSKPGRPDCQRTFSTILGKSSCQRCLVTSVENIDSSPFPVNTTCSAMYPIVEFNGKKYPKFQSEGNASQFSIPFAKHFCSGRGVDIGCMHKEWSYPGALPIDKRFPDEYDAYNLPEGLFDYIYSSHCLEHLEDWVGALDYWGTKLSSEGVLFLYLPHYSQEYWRPWNNRNHIHSLQPEILRDYFESKGLYHGILISGCDLNNSFYAIAVKI